MRRDRPRRVVQALLLLATLPIGGVAPATGAPPGSPWGVNYFPNVPLLTQDGRTVRFYDDLVKDKQVVISFIYTNCRDACPLETAKLVQLQQILGTRMGRAVFFYSITIDPSRDTPAVLKRYAETFHVGPGWLFLTGKEADIALLRKKLGLLAPHDSRDRFDHTANIVIGSEATGQWIRHSAFENPKFLAVMIRDWLDNWSSGKTPESYANVPRITPLEKGEYLFQTRCSPCHSIGLGDRLGPDLRDVASRRDRDWLARYLKAPDQMLAERDPIATALVARYGNLSMPNLHLSETDVAALLSYLERQPKAGPQAEHRTRRRAR